MAWGGASEPQGWVLVTLGARESEMPIVRHGATCHSWVMCEKMGIPCFKSPEGLLREDVTWVAACVGTAFGSEPWRILHRPPGWELGHRLSWPQRLVRVASPLGLHPFLVAHVLLPVLPPLPPVTRQSPHLQPFSTSCFLLSVSVSDYSSQLATHILLHWILFCYFLSHIF